MRFLSSIFSQVNLIIAPPSNATFASTDRDLVSVYPIFSTINSTIKKKMLGGSLLLSVAMMATGCASVKVPKLANTQAEKVDALFSKENSTDSTAPSGIAIRYPASIVLAGSDDEVATYERLVALTDKNLKKGGFFVKAGDISDETDLGAFFIRSTLLKSRLAAHAAQANFKALRPDVQVFTQPMKLTIHSFESGVGDCYYAEGDDAASFCLEARSVAAETPTPVSVVVDVAAFNDYNLTTYGLNSFRSLGHEISPLLSVGANSGGHGSSSGQQFIYVDGVRGSLPEGVSQSAFQCMVLACKKKPDSKSKSLRQKPIEFAEETIFESMLPVTDIVLQAALKRKTNYDIVIGTSSENIDGTRSDIPAFDDNTPYETAVEFLEIEAQFLAEKSAQSAAYFQNNLYQEALETLDSEEVFALKLRNENKSKRTDSVLGIVGAAAAMTGAFAAADVGDTQMAQQMLGNMNLFADFMELSVIETDLKAIDFSEDARAIESQVGEIVIANTNYENFNEQRFGSLSELRGVQRQLLARAQTTP